MRVRIGAFGGRRWPRERASPPVPAAEIANLSAAERAWWGWGSRSGRECRPDPPLRSPALGKHPG